MGWRLKSNRAGMGSTTSCWRGSGRWLLVVVDRFEEGAAATALVLQGHRLSAEERDDFGVVGGAVSASWSFLPPPYGGRVGERGRFSFLSLGQISSPRGRGACRRCGRQWLLCDRAGEREPNGSSRSSSRAPGFPGALRGVRGVRPGPCSTALPCNAGGP